MARKCSVADPTLVAAGFSGTPICLAASTTVDAQESLDLPREAFRNSTGRPVELHAMRWIADLSVSDILWTATTGSVALQTIPPPLVIGAMLELSIKYRDIPITAQPVQAYTLGRAEGQDVEQQLVGSDRGDTATASSRGSYCSGTWRFDYPFRLDPGEGLIVRAGHRGLIPLPITVTVAFVGRVGGVRGGPRKIPFVATFSPAPINSALVTTADKAIAISSTDQDLVNTSGQEIEVRRFVGRCAAYNVASTRDNPHNVV